MNKLNLELRPCTTDSTIDFFYGKPLLKSGTRWWFTRYFVPVNLDKSPGAICLFFQSLCTGVPVLFTKPFSKIGLFLSRVAASFYDGQPFIHEYHYQGIGQKT